jgi:mono/diheme cytochrome c family protein
VLRRASLLSLLALALAGCGTGGMADPEATGSASGQQLFTQKCGSCHVLEAAGTQGTIGPDLDAAFNAPRKEGFDESSIREVVLGQMRYPIPPMPDAEELFPLSADYTEQDRENDLDAIATFVASVAADKEASAAARAQGGGKDSNDPATLFASSCAGCHTFAPANAKGTVGPSLDGTSLDLAAIEEQIRKGGKGMPPFEGQLSDEQIKALAEYIAKGA